MSGILTIFTVQGHGDLPAVAAISSRKLLTHFENPSSPTTNRRNSRIHRNLAHVTTAVGATLLPSRTAVVSRTPLNTETDGVRWERRAHKQWRVCVQCNCSLWHVIELCYPFHPFVPCDSSSCWQRLYL